MVVSQLILLQKATRLICRDSVFRNRWIPLGSIVSALTARYNFNNVKVSKTSVSKALAKLYPMIGTLTEPHLSGFYRQQHGNKKMFFVQDPDLPPPKFFATTTGDLVNIKNTFQKIISTDQEMLSNYLNRLTRLKECSRSKKRKITTDEIDDILIDMNLKFLSVNRAKKKKLNGDEICSWSYWTSPEVISLFQPMAGETVEKCLVRRESLLYEATVNDDVLLSIVANVNDISMLTSKQKENLCKQCLY